MERYFSQGPVTRSNPGKLALKPLHFLQNESLILFPETLHLDLEKMSETFSVCASRVLGFAV